MSKNDRKNSTKTRKDDIKESDFLEMNNSNVVEVLSINDTTTIPNRSSREKDSIEIEKIRSEINDLLRMRKANESSECNSLTESKSILEGTNEVLDFIYKYGTTQDCIDLENSKEFNVMQNDEIISILVAKDAFIQKPLYAKDEVIHLIVHSFHDEYFAKSICDTEFFELFKPIKSLRQKLNAMKAFTKLSISQQQSIHQQLNGLKYDSDNDVGTSKITSIEQLRLKYDICKNTYSHQQQREIDDLFSQTNSGKNKAEKKLGYILNISPTYSNHRNLSYDNIMDILNFRVYGMIEVKQKIAEYLVASQYSSMRNLRILLVGNSGTGKTTLAQAIADISDLPYSIIPLNGVSNALSIKGLDASFGESDAGKLIRSFFTLGTSEAVIILKKIDKLGKSGNDGDPADALLDALSEDHQFYDEFLEIAIDTRNTVYIATASNIESIPNNLLERFEVFHIDDYEINDKIEIAKHYAIPKILNDYTFPNDNIIFSEEAILEIVSNYCYDEGTNRLIDSLKTIVRNIVNKWDAGKDISPVVVDRFMVNAILGKIENSDDLKLTYFREKNKYSEAVHKEIRNTFESLNNPEIEPHRKETDRKRLKYLISLISSHKGFEGFDEAKFLSCLNATHFGMHSVKNELAKTFFANSFKKESLSGVKILLVGGPGIGKSSICKSIATALDLPIVKISLNGISDDHTIKGFPKTFVDSDAGEIIRGLARYKTTSAVIQLDEVDKIGKKYGVDVSTSLIDLLDDSSEFSDYFLGVHVDLSDVLFIATANDLSHVHPLLLDRFTVINLEGYTLKNKESIIDNYLLPKFNKEYFGTDISFKLTQRAKKLILEGYFNSFGVRDVEKGLKKITKDKLYENRNSITNPLIIDYSDIMSSLGSIPIARGNYPSIILPGLSKALSVTGSNHGMAFAIETAIIPGDSSLEITGLPSDSAIDSVKIARNYIKCHYEDRLFGNGLHLHFGEGAVVKDGPSAGVAILISILSAVWTTPVVGNVAFTGEIDLFGNVFAVGGILEKIQAAELSGCSKVFIPYDNFKNLSEEELEQFLLEIIPIKHISEAINIALPNVKIRELSTKYSEHQFLGSN